LEILVLSGLVPDSLSLREAIRPEEGEFKLLRIPSSACRQGEGEASIAEWVSEPLSRPA